MKKRILPLLLALCLLAMMASPALAADGTCTSTDCNHVAAIGGMHYDLLDGAVTAVQPGETIKL